MPLVKLVQWPPREEPFWWRRPMVPPSFFAHGTVWRTGRGRRTAYWVVGFNAFDGTAMWCYMPPEQNKELYGS
jgi:hypothetical protein